MDMGLIQAAIHSARFAKDVMQNIADGKVQIESQDRILEALGKLSDVQAAMFDMRDELFRLQTENQGLKLALQAAEDWKAKLSNYELVETPAGGMVYKSKDGLEHYICPACLNKKEIHPLQNLGKYASSSECPGCGRKYNTHIAQDMPPLRRRGSMY